MNEDYKNKKGYKNARRLADGIKASDPAVIDEINSMLYADMAKTFPGMGLDKNKHFKEEVIAYAWVEILRCVNLHDSVYNIHWALIRGYNQAYTSAGCYSTKFFEKDGASSSEQSQLRRQTSVNATNDEGEEIGDHLLGVFMDPQPTLTVDDTVRMYLDGIVGQNLEIAKHMIDGLSQTEIAVKYGITRQGLKYKINHIIKPRIVLNIGRFKLHDMPDLTGRNGRYQGDLKPNEKAYVHKGQRKVRLTFKKVDK